MYSYARITELEEFNGHQPGPDARISPAGKDRGPLSVLFLHVYAAADYFTLNETLMSQVPPVLADVILDPYIGNVVPRSLLPTAVYIIILAVLAWFLSDLIWKGLVDVVRGGSPQVASDEALNEGRKKIQ